MYVVCFFVEWEVRVFTADRRFAGTDANVFITLYGRRGVAMKQQLRTTTMKNAFERGKEDTFLITTNDVGPISKIRYVQLKYRFLLPNFLIWTNKNQSFTLL